MKIFRKYKKQFPVIVIWFWLFAFFSDAANLDDFIGNTTVIHTDLPSEKTESTFSSQFHNQQNKPYQGFTTHSPKAFAYLKVIYDQDSPSLTPDFPDFTVTPVNNLQVKKIIPNSVSITKILYLEQRSLLI